MSDPRRRTLGKRVVQGRQGAGAQVRSATRAPPPEGDDDNGGDEQNHEATRQEAGRNGVVSRARAEDLHGNHLHPKCPSVPPDHLGHYVADGRWLRRQGLGFIRLLLSRARGPASPIPASYGTTTITTTTTTTRKTGANMRNTGADPKGAGAKAVAPMGSALAATAGVGSSGVGATAAVA